MPTSNCAEIAFDVVVMSERVPDEPQQVDDPEPPVSWRNDGQELLAIGFKIFVLEPLDFLLKAPAVVPQLLHEGRREWRKQSTIARFVGKSVVNNARRRCAVAPSTKVAPPTKVATRVPEADVEISPALSDPSPVTAADLPINGYDTLPAQAIVDLLGDLHPAALELVRRHETAHRRRRTVLSKIAQLFGDG